MQAAGGSQPIGIVTISRAVVSAAAELVAGVERVMVGDANVRTAQGNAWDAIQEDRARARARADMEELVAALRQHEPQTLPETQTRPETQTKASLISSGRQLV